MTSRSTENHVTVLFVSANPKDMCAEEIAFEIVDSGSSEVSDEDIDRLAKVHIAEGLSLDLECREVETAINSAQYRDTVQLRPCLAATAETIANAVATYSPTIIHFSGHGNRDALALLTARDGDGSFSASNMDVLFGQASPKPRLVV